MTLYLPAPGPRRNVIHCCQWQTLLRALPPECINAVITDPPYGLGIDEWDTPIDIPDFLSEVQRVLKPGGFFAFTIQMPMMIDWLVALRATRLRYKDHIAWVKRKHTNAVSPLCRSWESVFIYAKGNADYQTTTGKWEDVKLPGLAHALLTIDSVDRYVKDLRVKASGKTPVVRHSGAARHPAYAFMDFTSGLDRSAEDVNFTNVWSFLPENTAHFSGQYPHATMKPLKMFERMVELLTAPGSLILDPFVGSGTTALAARNQGRDFLACDMDTQSVKVAKVRLDELYTLNLFQEAT